MTGFHSEPVHAATRPMDPPPLAGSYSLAFQDDFGGNTLDLSQWHYCYALDDYRGCSGGNGEMEWYLPDAVTVSDGALHITATRRQVLDKHGLVRQYVSGLIEQTADHAFQYGYMETRFRFPGGRALWPAFWALPVTGGGPTELDICEVLGQQPNVTYLVDHYLTALGQWGTYDTFSPIADFSAGYHTVGLDWEPDALTWYIDGIAVYQVTDPQAIPHQPMVLILNMAVGGDWPGAPDATTPFPATMDVDWVRVWKWTGPAPASTPVPTVAAGSPSVTNRLPPLNQHTDSRTTNVSGEPPMMVTTMALAVLLLGGLAFWLLRSQPEKHLF